MSSLVERIQQAAIASGVFGGTEVRGCVLHCAAAQSSAPAWYRVATLPAGGIRVELATADRWLSESIESDLEHMRESIESLLSEELNELGALPLEGKLKHFRNEDREYIFEIEISPTGDVLTDEARAIAVLAAFQSTFALLGDMTATGDDR